MLSVLNVLSYLGLKATLLVVLGDNVILNFIHGNPREIKELAQGYIIRGRTGRTAHVSLFPVHLTPLKNSQAHRFVRSEHTFPSFPLSMSSFGEEFISSILTSLRHRIMPNREQELNGCQVNKMMN